MTLVFAYGTSAELIKYSPVLDMLRNHKDVQLWSTSQQGASVLVFEDMYGIESVTRLSNKPEKSLEKRSQVPKWAFTVALRALKFFWRLKKNRKLDTKLGVVVHGDTMTSTLIACVGWISRVDVIHIEAGLRSGSLRHPFPEELCRRATAYIAKVHFAPNVDAIENLAKRKGFKINTLGNTAQDALLMTLKDESISRHESFALVTLHRSELLGSTQELEAIFKALVEVAGQTALKIVLDELAMANIPVKILQTISNDPNIQILPKLPHDEFVRQLNESLFVITDSGGIQEECAVLGKPCLVHRKSTERMDGIGENALLSNWDQNLVRWFLSNHAQFERTAKQPENSPSAIVVSALKSLHYVV
jgi:UDP-N-acetylglucosamine 2-epimerase (non-hydrolysing)